MKKILPKPGHRFAYLCLDNVLVCVDKPCMRFNSYEHFNLKIWAGLNDVRHTLVTVLHTSRNSADPMVVQYQNTLINKVSFGLRIHQNPNLKINYILQLVVNLQRLATLACQWLGNVDICMQNEIKRHLAQELGSFSLTSNGRTDGRTD